MALHDAAPLYRDAPEAREARTSDASIFHGFMQQALPHAPVQVRALVADLIRTTLTQAGKRFSETPRTAAEIETYSGAMADMFCAYIESLGIVRRRVR